MVTRPQESPGSESSQKKGRHGWTLAPPPFYRPVVSTVLQLHEPDVHWHSIFLLVPVALHHPDRYSDSSTLLAESIALRNHTMSMVARSMRSYRPSIYLPGKGEVHNG